MGDIGSFVSKVEITRQLNRVTSIRQTERWKFALILKRVAFLMLRKVTLTERVKWFVTRKLILRDNICDSRRIELRVMEVWVPSDSQSQIVGYPAFDFLAGWSATGWVIWGFEPQAGRVWIYCSTNWAKLPFKLVGVWNLEGRVQFPGHRLRSSISN